MGSYFSLVAIAILFPRKQNHCASPNSFFSPRWNSVSITKDFCKLICSARFPGLKILARVLMGTLLEFPSLCHSRPSPQLNWGGAAVRRLGFPAQAWILLHAITNLILRGFISEAGLKFQPRYKPGWNFSWDSPGNQTLRHRAFFFIIFSARSKLKTLKEKIFELSESDFAIESWKWLSNCTKFSIFSWWEMMLHLQPRGFIT